MTPERKSYLLSLISFPQMTINESAIIHAWLLEHVDEYDDVDFNVRVGNSVDIGPGATDVQRKQAAALSQKRADVVAYKDGAVTIVEAKPRLTLSALGQLLGYAVLWQADNPLTKAVHLVAIGHTALVDAVEVLHAHNITTELFPDLTLVQVNRP